VKTSYLEGQGTRSLLSSLILCYVMSPVLGFCHVAASGITADVLGRHLTVETERIRNILQIFQKST
jgi:hypothetical protein